MRALRGQRAAHARAAHAWGSAPDFAAIRELAAKYSEASFRALGTGGSGVRIRLAREVTNAYSTLPTARDHATRGAVCRRRGAEKVLFGSDCYFFSMTSRLARSSAPISDGEKRKILSENALRILERVQR